jgi:hypothetical protein
MQVDNETACAEVLAVSRVHDDTAAGRQHDPVPLRQVVDDLCLAFPESVFAFLFKNERDVDAGARLDLFVAVDEVQVQKAGELSPDRRLAGAHRAYQEHVLCTVHRGNSVNIFCGRAQRSFASTGKRKPTRRLAFTDRMRPVI